MRRRRSTQCRCFSVNSLIAEQPFRVLNFCGNLEMLGVLVMSLVLISPLPLLPLLLIAAVAVRVLKVFRSAKTVAFFHPHAAGRGGGERVLWAAVDALINRSDISKVVIYSIDTNREAILSAKNATFNFKTSPSQSKIEFKRVYFSSLLEAGFWPIAAIFGQSIGSVLVLISALLTSTSWPDIFVDTTGCPFTLPAAKLLTGAKTSAYIHYPTMSRDMLAKVINKETDFNNKLVYAKSGWLQQLKLLYYKIFLFLYRCCGWFADVAVGNSRWTVSRICDVWHRNDVQVLYPPAAIGDGTRISALPKETRENAILSLAQFRPEKNHKLQLTVFARVLQKAPETMFWMMGGARNESDLQLVEDLKQFAFKDLRIPEERIEFIINAPWSEISDRLRRAKCAIHTMKDEHFGISLLEFLEAKIPVVAHRSGGPEMDILLPDEQFGFLATSESEFATKVLHVLKSFDQLADRRIEAYNSLSRFLSDQRFGAEFSKILVYFL